MMSEKQRKNNAKTVTQAWREKKGNKKRKSNYMILTKEFNIDCIQASKMRFWSDIRIDTYLKENDSNKKWADYSG